MLRKTHELRNEVGQPHACQRFFIPGMNHRGFQAKFSVICSEM
jgi:hypothetical protein